MKKEPSKIKLYLAKQASFISIVKTTHANIERKLGLFLLDLGVR